MRLKVGEKCNLSLGPIVSSFAFLIGCYELSLILFSITFLE